jgi:hypothetical protein
MKLEISERRTLWDIRDIHGCGYCRSQSAMLLAKKSACRSHAPIDF